MLRGIVFPKTGISCNDHFSAALEEEGVARAEDHSVLVLPPDKPVFMFIGLCKPYKKLHELVSVFRHSDPDAFLLVAGKFSDAAYRDRIVELAGDDPCIRIREGFIPDAQIQHFLKACDVVVVPYREILTSDTAMLALSFGRPLISVDFGFLRDVVTEQVGILLALDDPDSLASGVVAA